MLRYAYGALLLSVAVVLRSYGHYAQAVVFAAVSAYVLASLLKEKMNL